MKIFIALMLLTFTSFADFINDLEKNPKVIVVYGENASEKEHNLAKEIYSTLQLDKTGDIYDHIITDTYALKHQFYYANFHLIVVGTNKSNKLCKLNAEIQYAVPEKNNSPTRILPQLNHAKGLFSSRYGYYPQATGIGYIRRILNPFTLQAFNLAGHKFKAAPYTAIFITGTDFQGVQNAYAQMFDNQMLEGISVPEKNLQETRGRYKLAKKNVSNSIPNEINKALTLSMDKSKLSYKGWIQGALADYAGVQNLSGVSPTQVFHLKFQTEKLSLMTYDEQANTLLLIKYYSSQESLKALKGIDKSLRLALTINDKPDFSLYGCSNGSHQYSIIRKGEFIIIENLSSSWKDSFTKNANKLFK
jgi:hypothetical protein